MKTKTCIFSALTEGEASDLATGLTKTLCQNVSAKLVRKDIGDHNAEVNRYTTLLIFDVILLTVSSFSFSLKDNSG